jgi:O-antigen/teichoic acid export membrane protein
VSARRLLARATSILTSGTGWLVGGALAGMALQFAGTAVLVADVPVGAFGRFISVFAFATLVTQFCTAGIYQLLIKEIARAGRTLRSDLWRALWPALILYGLTAVPFAVIVSHAIQGTSISTAACIHLGAELASALQGVSLAVFNANRRLRTVALVNMLRGSVILLVGVAALVGIETTQAIGLAYLTAAAAYAVVVGAMTVTAVESGTRSDAPTSGLLRQHLTIGVGSLSAAGYRSADQGLLGAVGQLADAGLYGLGVRILSVATAVPTAHIDAGHRTTLDALSAPGTARDAIERRLRVTVLLAVAAATAAVAGSFVFSRVLPTSYRDVPLVVLFLAAGTPLIAASAQLSFVLVGIDQHTRRTAVQISVFILNLVLNLALIPSFGWRGSAAATVATEATLTTLLYVLFRFALDNRPTDPLPTPCSQ